MECSSLDATTKSLLNAEKQCRLAGEVAGGRKSALDIVEIRFKDGAWKTLNDQIVLLSKRRGELKQEIADIKEEQGKIDEVVEIMQKAVGLMLLSPE